MLHGKWESSKEGDTPPAAPSVKKERLLPLDALRGFIMVVMALDHASYYIAEVHPEEFWGIPLPLHIAALPFLTRWITHLAASGFFFLMGVSMVLFAESRRGFGWSEEKITRYFASRGFLLIVIQVVLINAAWIPGSSVMGTRLPGDGNPFWLFHAGVLYGLGASMIVWALFLRFGSAVLTCISLGAILATQALIPPPEKVAVLYSPLVCALLIPGKAGLLSAYYPVVPWLGLTGLGIIFGKELLRDRKRAYNIALISGLSSLLLFAVLRYLRAPIDFHPLGDNFNWISFLNVTKYPPSIAFILITLGLNLIILSILARRLDSGLAKWANPLLTFGRTALFFYVVHLYLYALIGFLIPGKTRLALMYFWWLIGLLLLYPLCKWYGDFKQRTPPDSVWRLF